jgi:hypothetical protein
VASGLARPYAIAVARETVYVVEAGQLGRATGGIKRVLADGSVAPLRLRRG